MSPPHYPEIRVGTASDNSLALVAAVRLALRRAKVDRREIHRFSSEAMSTDDPRRRREVCRHWVRIESC